MLLHLNIYGFNSRYAGKIHHKPKVLQTNYYGVSIPAMRVRYIYSEYIYMHGHQVSIPAMRVRYIVVPCLSE